jgi:hypothetical protein
VHFFCISSAFLLHFFCISALEFVHYNRTLIQCARCSFSPQCCIECGVSPDDWIPSASAGGASKSVLRRMFRIFASLVEDSHFTLANQAFTVSEHRTLRSCMIS